MKQDLDMFDWNKLSEKEKKMLAKLSKLTFIPGPVRMSKRRISQLTSDQQGIVLFGCLKDEEIPGLEGSLQFKPLRISDLKPALKNEKKVCILEHFHKDIKYIIKELKPSEVLFVNGSWKGQIHYRSEYWKALDVGAKVELISPFVSEKEARRIESEVNSEAVKQEGKMYFKTRKYSDKELVRLAKEVAKRSWDWIGQIGAVLSGNQKVLAVAWNRVVPYEAYQMHFGSIREKLQTPAQEMIETQLTNHAEVEILEITRQKKISLKNTWLYINMFPCPVCAKMLSRTEIEGIVYSQDHNLGNDIGYKVLSLSGKKLRRIVK